MFQINLFFFFSLAAVFFIEFWKRHQKEIEYDWDVSNFEDEEVF